MNQAFGNSRSEDRYLARNHVHDQGRMAKKTGPERSLEGRADGEINARAVGADFSTTGQRHRKP